MSKAPSRALRGRWGAIDAVEKILVKAISRLAAVIRSVFRGSKKFKASKVGAAEDKEYQEQQSRCKKNVLTLMQAPLFLAMIV
eukprot:3175094-Pyramimonas_sp.AAC.1